MKLNLRALQNRFHWQERGYLMPAFDIAEVKAATLAEPTWLHFGAGNIFRAFPAVLQQRLLDRGLSNKGIIVCESYDEEIVNRAYAPYDNLSLVVTLQAGGNIQKEVVASIVEAIPARGNYGFLEAVFTSPSLQMVSFTITEKGYSLMDSQNNYFPRVMQEFESMKERPVSLMGLVAYLCYQRYLAGQLPLALVSMDNCSRNGTVLANAVKTFAEQWQKRGLIDPGFVDYLDNPNLVSFPWSMIDKITPRPSEQVKSILEAEGYESADIVSTAKNTFVSSFVNGEDTQYLVIEDAFPNGRPPLEEAGVIFTDRETVDKVEKMKVGTCLNPLHTVLAVYGCLLGYTSIAEEMKDQHLSRFIERLAYQEGLPVAVDPGIIKPEDFLREVIDKRLPNPFLPDSPQRIACDTSQKIPIRFGETLKAYLASGRDISELTYIPLFIAGWLRYLLAVDDEGNRFTPSPDPMLEVLQSSLKGVSLGYEGPLTDYIKPILSNTKIFGLDLFEHGMAAKVEAMFRELLACKGAVRRTLDKYIY
jgi:fructuronate reductase